MLALGLQEQIVDLLALGEVARLDESLKRFGEVINALRQPFFVWFGSAFRSMRALLDGRVEEAERLARTTLTLGQKLGTPNALPLFAGQLFCIRLEQGRLDELESALRSSIESQPQLPALRAGLEIGRASCRGRV